MATFWRFFCELKEKERKKKKPQDENIYGLPYYTGQP